jgi:predicted nucleic acid-binding protein
VAKKDEFVVDASVVTKWFLVEPDSDKAIRLRDDFATGRTKLTVPALLFYEVINALRFSGEFGEAELRLAAKSLSKYRFGMWTPRGKLLELTAELSLREGLTAYDACYVALARRIKSKVITEDGELLGKFPAHTMRMTGYSSSET